MMARQPLLFNNLIDALELQLDIPRFRVNVVDHTHSGAISIITRQGLPLDVKST